MSQAELTRQQKIELALRGHLTLREQVKCYEAEVINAAISECCGNQCKAAELLGMHRNTLSRKIEEMRDHKLLRASLSRADYLVKKSPRPVTDLRSAERMIS